MNPPTRREFLKAAAAGMDAARQTTRIRQVGSECVSSTPVLLAVDSYFEGRSIAWDPEPMKRHAS